MAADPNAFEQAVSRALRDNLERIQRSADELHLAVNDLVSACASSRPSNALPPMIRAQASAASLSAALDVLARFVTGALQSSARGPFETEAFRVPTMAAPEQPAPAHSHQISGRLPVEAQVTQAEPAPFPGGLSAAGVSELVREAPRVEPAPVAKPAAPRVPAAFDVPTPPARVPEPEPIFVNEPVHVPVAESNPEAELVEAVAAQLDVERAEAEPIFTLDSLPPEEQELHRRASRVAKVSMQDIRMLRPEDVRLGRENKDLCVRLREDIEKAHKEYDRRFQSIQSHPVDYFYDWMVEILAGGDRQALGEYPYPSPAVRR
jgi:hypothetical protein